MSRGGHPAEQAVEIMLAAWDGRSLGDGPLALVPKSGSTPGSSDFILLVAHGEDQALEVPPDRIGDFLQAHREAGIVTLDAALLFWALHDHLQTRNEEAARQELWGQARAGRIFDVELNWRYLADLRGRGLLPRHGDGGPIPAPDDPRPILATFREQCRQESSRPGGPSPEAAVPRPDAISILASRVRGRIALQRPGRPGLIIRRDRIPAIRERFGEIFDEACRDLQQDESSRKAFRWDGGRVRRTSAGLPGQVPVHRCSHTLVM